MDLFFELFKSKKSEKNWIQQVQILPPRLQSLDVSRLRTQHQRQGPRSHGSFWALGI